MKSGVTGGQNHFNLYITECILFLVMFISKLSQNTAKYIIRATLKANGVIEKHDVIGAIFGQTEGILGMELDLRELQRTGRIGRIEVDIKNNGTSEATITIPSSLDSTETALIAATLETIDKVGPCTAKVNTTSIEDMMFAKRKYVVERSKDLLKKILEETPDTKNILEDIRKDLRAEEVSEYKGLVCGPDINQEDLIIVEGRADVINLLKSGIRNVVAIEGNIIPKPLIDIAKQKTTTVFLDGDRGGDLILRKLLKTIDLDFVARAPKGKEVEELTKKEIYKKLRDAVPVKEFLDVPSIDEKTRRKLRGYLNDIIGTKHAFILEPGLNIAEKVAIKDLPEKDFRGKDILVFDGKITKKIVDFAREMGIKTLVAIEKDTMIRPAGMFFVTKKDLDKTYRIRNDF